MTIARNAAQLAILAGEKVARRRPGISDQSVARSFLFLVYEKALGSVVHATPAIEATKRAFPSATISVASYGIALEVLQHNPFIDHLIPTPDPYKHLWTSASALRRIVRAMEHPACILTTHGSSRSRIALLAVLAGEAIRAGYSLAPLLYDKVAVYDRRESLIRNNLRVPELVGVPYRHFEPRVWFSKGDLARAQTLLVENGVREDVPVAIFITQTSGGQPTSWREERFVSVANHVANRHGYRLVFVGTGKESAAIERIRLRLQTNSVSVAGRTSVSELAALMSLSDVAVTLDTGPMHVGRAAQVPMVVIAPAWQSAIEWLPLGIDRVEVLRGKDIPSAPPGYMIDEVSVADVRAALDKLIARFPASGEARRERVEMSLRSNPVIGQLAL